MRKFYFTDIQIGEAFVSGIVEFSANSTNEGSTAPWDMQDEKLHIYWKYMIFNEFHSDFQFSNKLSAHDLGFAAVLGYGFDKFKEEMRERITKYCDSNSLWE